jgi:hypothetical protein
MTTQILIPARAKSLQSAATPIDFQMAESILDRLKYTLRDLSLEFGDVIIEDGDITHELYYPSINNSHTIAGYIYCENGIYYASGSHWNNHKTPEQAALDLLDRAIVNDCLYQIKLERAAAPDYM